MRNVLRAIILVAFLAGANAAQAAVYTLQDSATNWTGYSGATPNQDPFGVPIFSATNAGSVTVTSNHLQSLSITYSNSNSSSTNSLWQYLKPGDVFIDSDSNGAWNYVLRTPYFNNANYYQSGTGPLYNNTLSWQVLDVSAVDLRYDNNSDASSYQMGNASTTATGQSWSGIAQTRVGHPWSVTDAFTTSAGVINLGSISTTDAWDNLTAPKNSSGTMTWDLLPLSSQLSVSNGIVISFTINCSNDVMFDQTLIPAETLAPVPAPTGLASWLLGLAFAAIIRRNIFDAV